MSETVSCYIIIREQNQNIAGAGKVRLKINKNSRIQMDKQLKLYVYCNFLKVFLVFDFFSFYLCRVFTYRQQLIYISRKKGKGRESDWKYPFILRKSMNYLYVSTDINHYLSQLSANPAIDYRFIRPVYDSMIHACQIDLSRLL